MSREIKFRAWDNDKNKWLNKENEEYFVMYLDGSYEINRGWCIVKPNLTIEQYTGLKDKNGKEIYDGDIVKVVGVGVSRVIQSGWGEWQLCDLTNSDGNILSLGYCLGREYCDVISNIHENPELLGGKNE